MRIYLKKAFTLLALFLILFGWNLSAQVVSPVKWTFSQRKISEKEIELSFKATIDQGWHLYGTDLPDGGPVSTSFKFSKDSTNFVLDGVLTSTSQPIKQFDKIFNLQLSYYALEAHFVRNVRILSDKAFVI